MKRQHFSPASPTVAAAAKKTQFQPCSEERKLDNTVLQYRNQKLSQQLEFQKFEYSALQKKFNQLRDDQKFYGDTLNTVKKSWEQLVDELEPLSSKTSASLIRNSTFHYEASSSSKESLFSRLIETGATESSSGTTSHSELDEDLEKTKAKSEKILENVVSALSKLWTVNNHVTTSILGKLPDEDFTQDLQKSVRTSHEDVKNLRAVAWDLQAKHRSLSKDVDDHRDKNAKYKAQNKRLSGELQATNAELKESKNELSLLKSQRENGHGSPFFVSPLGSKCTSRIANKDRDEEMNELESAQKQMQELASSRLQEIQSLHQKRKEMFCKLSDIQSAVEKEVSSSKTFQSLDEQIGKSRAELDGCLALLQKLQVEKDSFVWREKEATLKVDMTEVSREVSAFSESKIAEMESLLLKIVEERALLETKLEEASKEPGRKVIISQFKSLVSSLPKEMEKMQAQLTKYKEDASEIHSLRAEVKSLAGLLEREENELKVLQRRSDEQISEMKNLQVTFLDLKMCCRELNAFLEMYRREITDSSEMVEARDSEFKAWARVQSLKSSLKEHNLESRVKAANEAEATSQQRLAASEAQISELRQKLEVTTREIGKLTDVLRSKCEEGEAYLSEIESIGQAYEDLQSQNQNLLQQITERDDYNIKLVLEGVKERQLHDALQMETQNMTREIKQASISQDFYNLKLVRIEDQMRNLLDQVGKLVEEGSQYALGLENIKRRLLDMRKDSLQVRRAVDQSTLKLEGSRKEIASLQITLAEERFKNNRIDEDLEVKQRKVEHLKSQSRSSLLNKLQQEHAEYKGILKCGICRDRQKEVVIAKCYHLVCNPCVQRVLESRHRKCPVCGVSFGSNDIKPIYI